MQVPNNNGRSSVVGAISRRMSWNNGEGKKDSISKSGTLFSKLNQPMTAIVGCNVPYFTVTRLQRIIINTFFRDTHCVEETATALCPKNMLYRYLKTRMFAFL